MVARDWKNAPADPAAVAAVAATGLEYRVIDTADAAVFDPYLQAETRGFLSGEQSEEQLGGSREGLAFRRFTGVYDPAALDTSQPVGTVNSWVTEMSMPGRRGIPMWAISGVTVAPTHRRKGIARAMLEGELRTAADLGLPLAGLTVSEATIYGRFGFSPATFATDWSIETKRAIWAGPRPEGRLDFVDRERLRDMLGEVHDRVRPARPGEIEGWPGLWRRMSGTAPGQENAHKVRGVRYADATGATRGVAVYRLSDEGADFTKHELELHQLVGETPDAYAALWRFILEHDLVSVVKASLLSVDEPLRWMIADQRGAKVETSEHGWLRILDVPAVLTARTYAAPGSFVLRVTDPLGFADGSWRLEIDDTGNATVVAADASPDLTLSVNSLSSLLLGGVRAATLAAAGLVDARPAALAAFEAAFTAPASPYLSLWY
ncbi:GNAT family N-acetyltransferase [Microbacterium sp. zg.B48]|uniref:GNAT family N-acetyltransferase n=1 Tax=Microbacterium sp. zg.B48 TaxID=2969408 RepID=UPI00214AE0AD|nr:GNAT family N-acetyltransferase [Microbacterium sp. zg.B48]MCR2764669.1 GNAT family N-acetyltransferase [Microbacterium sp. zg.B48]